MKSSQGDADWLRFFALMGTAMAIREKAPPVPNTPVGVELVDELRHYHEELLLTEHLQAYRTALNVLQRARPNAHHFVLEFDRRERQISITGYPESRLEQASQQLLALERTIPERPWLDVVLVSTDSMNALKRAYPNYFMDTRRFTNEVDRVLGIIP